MPLAIITVEMSPYTLREGIITITRDRKTSVFIYHEIIYWKEAVLYIFTEDTFTRNVPFLLLFLHKYIENKRS